MPAHPECVGDWWNNPPAANEKGRFFVGRASDARTDVGDAPLFRSAKLSGSRDVALYLGQSIETVETRALIDRLLKNESVVQAMARATVTGLHTICTRRWPKRGRVEGQVLVVLPGRSEGRARKAAMKALRLEAERDGRTDYFEHDLARGAAALAAAVDRDRRVVRLATPRVNELSYGQASAWLRGRLERALTQAGVRVLPPNPTAPGLHVQADAYERTELGLSMLEVQWRAVRRGVPEPQRFPLVSEAAFCPFAAIPGGAPPRMQGRRTSLWSDGAVKLDVVGAVDGRICEWSTINLGVTTPTSKHFRVVNLYGRQGAWAPGVATGDQLGPGRTELWGPAGLKVVLPPRAPESRYLVITAPTEAALGWARPLYGGCRLSPRDAERLRHDPELGLPAGARVDEIGYVVTTQRCPHTLRPAQRQAILSRVARLPVCSTEGRP